MQIRDDRHERGIAEKKLQSMIKRFIPSLHSSPEKIHLLLFFFCGKQIGYFILDQTSKKFNQPNRHHIVEGAGANACPGKDSLSKINCCFLAPKKTPKLLQSAPNNLVLSVSRQALSCLNFERKTNL